MLFNKKEEKVNLEKGKKIFFENCGNIFIIERNLGPTEYKECNIPKELEEQWTKELQEDILNKIKKAETKEDVHSLFVELSFLRIHVDERIKPIIEYLNNNELDTFTTLLLCEMMEEEEKYVSDESFKNKIDEVIDIYVKKMLNEPIVIDESYKNDGHMRGYDCSDENIRRRIMCLVK